ncbi:MAG: flavodoxin-dependent (E)-4-hydroxy-3-methylbut-2-enyl-diphosphate synthase [Candidatus Omnitrophota bacterium]
MGSGYPIAIQSMVKVQAKDVEASVRQIGELEEGGCEIVRIAVEDKKDALSLKNIRRQTHLPLVADIHFDYRLALASIDSGVDKVRLNPGNIYKPKEVLSIIAAAKGARIPIRIGANSGSLRVRSKDIAGALVKSVMDYLDLFKKANFHDLVVSLKGSNIFDTMAAYEKIAKLCDYPLHLGITATGLPLDGVVKSSIGLGFLLFKGIGDTIRISLLGSPQQEVEVAQFLLNNLGLRKFGPELICCPTCGRCEVDLLEKAKNLKSQINELGAREKARLNNYKVALMGCVVNGPGEAREADLGIAFSKHKGVLFKKGKIVRSVSLENGEKEVFKMLKEIAIGGHNA